MATPLIRTLSLVPRVAGLEEFHYTSLHSSPTNLGGVLVGYMVKGEDLGFRFAVHS